jgi:hypothetical protein
MHVNFNNLENVTVSANDAELALMRRVIEHIDSNYDDVDASATNIVREQLDAAVSEITPANNNFSLSRAGYFALTASLRYVHHFDNVADFFNEYEIKQIRQMEDFLSPVGGVSSEPYAFKKEV